MGRLMGSSNSNNYGEQIFIMQIVYYLYDQCYNRYNSHGSVILSLIHISEPTRP